MERIYVTVRARPLSPEDAKCSPWRIAGNSISLQNQLSKFEFDRIFGEDCKNREVYEARTKEIVSAAVCGFNGTVFAYGQTSSGKTHTMRGSIHEPGVIPLAVRELFDMIEKDADREFLLRMSYMEIYNEEINDLLAPEHRKLQIHESIERGIYVAGLREEIVASPEQVLSLMEFGETHRHIGETNMNLHSSRSHTIFRMIIESRDRPEEGELENSCDAVRVSVLNLVDLAGSERVAKTGAEGVRLKEGSHINKSLLTLGTVIKKLSEGVESQGGHVPYRDSKLTRILQPALGGNANTAIICNITLAQIHADETKSSLQFASRALRVTNCAHVNEVLTDAALMKRQKKEIEELRAKLQSSQSEHFEEEILHLRNTLLQTESERERIALQLEEEKRSQAERDKRLEEQDKKIKNLSSMVLISNRDDHREHRKRDKRRDTWCPGKLDRETFIDASPVASTKTIVAESARPNREVGPLLSFEELVDEKEASLGPLPRQLDDCNDNVTEKIPPASCELLKVTHRRKPSLKKKNVPVEKSELSELQTAYEELLLNFETQSTKYEVQLDCLTRKLNEASMSGYNFCSKCLDNPANGQDNSAASRESDAILMIKRLQDQIAELEQERSLSQQNLDNVYELAKLQNVQAREEFDKLRKELSDAKEEAGAAKLALDQLKSVEDASRSEMIDTDCIIKLFLEVQHTFDELDSFGTEVETHSTVNNELLQSYSSMLTLFSDFRSSLSDQMMQLQSFAQDYQTLKSSYERKLNSLASEKAILVNESVSLHEEIEGLKTTIQKSEKALADLSEEHGSERSELVAYIQLLEKEISSLSSSSLSKEKESLRKDLEKTRTKLKDTEAKLKNAIQDKTRLEGERANAEREIKRLNGQKLLLERDVSRQQSRDPTRRESVAGRKRESFLGRGPNVSESRKPKGQEDDSQQILQEEYKKLEVLAFEMESTIGSLEEELASVKQEKEEITARNETLSFELEVLYEKLNTSDTSSATLHEEVARLKSELEKSEAGHQELANRVNLMSEEKEELAMQLTDALLALEEERAIWSSKEQASVEAIQQKTKAYQNEILSLSSEISKAKTEMLSYKEECTTLRERLKRAEEDTELEKKCSSEMLMQIDRLKLNLEELRFEKDNSDELFKSKIDMLQLENEQALNQVSNLEVELTTLRKDNDELVHQMQEHMPSDDKSNVVEELTKRCTELEAEIQKVRNNNRKEITKLRMRARHTQASLDGFRERFRETEEEKDFMHAKFKEASASLKSRLVDKTTEILDLKKHLTAVEAQLARRSTITSNGSTH